MKNKYDLKKIARKTILAGALASYLAFPSNLSKTDYTPKPEPTSTIKISKLEERASCSFEEFLTEKKIEIPKYQNNEIRKITANNYKTRIIKDSEVVLLAKLLYGEARSLSEEEAAMIGLTAVNRSKDKIKANGTSLEGAILAKGQYNCFDNDGSKNSKETKNPSKYDIESWARSLKLSKKILEGEFNYLNGGQTHYYHPKSVKKIPKWAKDQRYEKIATSTEHKFYRDKKG